MSPKYLSDIISSTTRRYSSRNENNIPLVGVHNNYFMNTFFPSTITEWNKRKRLSSVNNSAKTIHKIAIADRSIINQGEITLFKLSFMVIQLILSMITN